LRRGVAERVLYLRKGTKFHKCHVPSEELVDDRLGEFRIRLTKKLCPTTPIDIEEFPLLYSGRKRETYRLAVESLRYEPINEKDAWLKVFTKFEKINFTLKPDPAPRIISPRSPRYNAALGRYLKPAEGLLYKGIARVWGDRTVAKGLNSSQVGALIAKKWHSFVSPCAIGLDASRFDQHVSAPMLKYEHSIHFIQSPYKELRKLLNWQLHNKGFGYCPDGKLKYEVKGCRMSGDMNTGSGNCLLMCAMVWSYARARGVNCKLINNGDDCVVFMESSDAEKFCYGLDKWFNELGFDMKQEPTVFELEKVEFCQAHPIHVGNGEYIMVRNLEASLGKDALCLVQANHPDAVLAWCKSVGDAGTACCGGIPVLDSFYKMYSRVGIDNNKWQHTYGETGFSFMARGMTRRGLPVLPETRLSYYIAFGVLPDEQEALEEYFDRFHIRGGLPSAPTEVSPDLKSELTDIITRACANKLSC